MHWFTDRSGGRLAHGEPAECGSGTDQGSPDSRSCRIIKDRGLTQVEAAKILGFSSLMSQRSPEIAQDLFRSTRLIDFLTALGPDVDIAVMPTRKEHGAM